MQILRTNFSDDPNIGLYGFATDAYCFTGVNPNKKISNVLKVPMQKSTVLDTRLSGIFCAGNSSGILVPHVIEDYELEILSKLTKTLVVKSMYTALGNLILMNDNGIVISPLLKKSKEEIAAFFNLPCEIATIANQKLVGAFALATNKGCLVQPNIKETEKNFLEKFLKVDIDIGTVNFGSPFIKSGIIANSHGVIISDVSSGPELGKITEALKFL
jgi:translation initiation factor 6